MLKRTPIILLLMILAAPAFAAEDPSWNFAAGLTAATIDETARAAATGGTAVLEVDNVLSPFIRAEYALDRTWSLELQGALDFYGGERAISNPQLCGDENLSGITLSAAPVWRGAERSFPKLGPWRPLVKAGLRYSWLNNDLKFLVNSYAPSLGADLSCGMTFKNWELRLTAMAIDHDKRSTAPGYSGPDDLDLSRLGLEISIPAETVVGLFKKD